MISQIKHTETPGALNKEIDKLEKKIKTAQDKVEKQLSGQKFPIWELNPVISDLFANVEFFQDASKQKYILEWISEQERIDQLFDAFKNAIPIAISIMCFSMPDGVSVALLILLGANATGGAVAAIDDINDAARHRGMAYSQYHITDEQKKLIKDCNVNEMDLNLMIAVISGLFVIADVADCARIGELPDQEI